MKTLAKTLRDAAQEILDNDGVLEASKTAAHLTQCLARALERDFLTLDQVYALFGAPGDWGYGTPIGKALQTLYKAGAEAEEAPAVKEQIRYSFRMSDGRLPTQAGKLSWMADRDKAEESARSWGSKTLLILAPSNDESWVISQEVPLT